MAIDAATRERIQRDFPAFASLLDIPDIANLLGRAAVEGWDITKLQANVYASPWWKGHSEAQRNAAILYRTDPGSYKAKVGNTKGNLQAEAMRLGWNASPGDIAWLSTRAVNEGWDAQRMTREVVAQMSRYGPSVQNPGFIQATQAAITQMSSQYGIGISTAQSRKYAYQVAAGQQTMDGVKQYFYNFALWQAESQGNTQLARGLKAGFSTWDILAPTIGLMAEELEAPVNGFSLTSGLGAKLLNYRDPQTNQLRMMTQSEAVQLARSQPAWRKTNRAEAVTAEAIDGISQFMGVKA